MRAGRLLPFFFAIDYSAVATTTTTTVTTVMCDYYHLFIMIILFLFVTNTMCPPLISADHKVYCDIYAGVYVVRGDNIVLLGEVDEERDSNNPNLRRIGLRYTLIDINIMYMHRDQVLLEGGALF